MTDTKTQPEPTMEEILASIRRIISENDEEQEAKKRIEAAPDSAAPVVAAAAVLELTDMVTEDGTVVSLSGAQPDAVVQDEAKDEIVEVESEEDVAVEAPADNRMDEIVESVGRSESAETPDSADTMEVTMENPKDESADFVPSSQATKNTGASMDDGLVSAATAASATATFAQLARTLAQEPTTAGNMALGSGRTLEDLVKEMLRPMLKEWLDKNLPTLVEHAVTRELDRMTRRAGDV